VVRYDIKRAALELKGNPLLPDLLEQLKQDVLQQFPTAAEHELVGLQIEYNLAEKLGTMVNNAVHREAD
jgi:hypothetical protein